MTSARVRKFTNLVGGPTCLHSLARGAFILDLEESKEAKYCQPYEAIERTGIEGEPVKC